MKKSDFIHKFTRFEKVIANDLELLKNNLFTKHENGYRVFDKYDIFQSDNKTQVVDIVSGDTVANFSNVRNALSWCIAEKNSDMGLAKTIKTLDGSIKRIVDDLYTRRLTLKLIKDDQKADIVNNKIEARQYHVDGLKQQLEKCTKSAKYWQTRGFNNEIERIGRSTPNKNYI